MTLGEHIEKILAEKNISKTELAEKTGIDLTYLSRIISGGRIPKIDKLEKIAHVLGVSTYYLRTCKQGKGIAVIAYISAGEGILSESCNQYAVGQGFDYLSLPPGYTQEQAEKECLYAVRVKGDSMLPALKDGWNLYIKPHADKSTLKSGDLVIFRDAEGAGWVKEIEILNHDSIIFKSIGPGPTIIKKREEITVIERVYLIMP